VKFRRKSDQTIDVTRLSSLIDGGVEIVGDVLITDGRGGELTTEACK